MDLGLKDKVIAVTGSASGIGAEMAHMFTTEGACVAVLDINGDAAEEVAASIRNAGGHAAAWRMDVTDLAAVETVFGEILAKFGALHGLVNNAGFPRDNYLTRMSPEDWDSVLGVILKGAFNCTRTAVSTMIEAKFGRIINIASRAYLGNPGQANYAAAKAGLIGFTKAVALECGKFDITCNAIAPGLVDTPLVSGLPGFDDMAARFVANTPIRRIGQPTDIAAAALFLASDHAGYVTGEVFHVTGGRYA